MNNVSDDLTNALVGQLPDLIPASVLLPVLFDYAATFIWALSGALIAARKGYVGMGIITIAVISSNGGGLLRDGLLLHSGPPALLVNPGYLLVSAVAFGLVMIGGKYVDHFKLLGPTVHFVDAVGAGTYAMVGVNRAIAAELPFVAVIIVGIVNAVGGGLLRDVLMRRVPDLFKSSHPFGVASMLGATLFAVLAMGTGLHQSTAAFITIGVVFVFCVVMLHFHIKARPLEAFREYWDETL